jgi:peptide deformylase
MTVLKIVEYPDKRLKTKTDAVSEVNDEIRKLVADMIETMYADRGMGLAANQVGVNKRIFVMDDSPDGKNPKCYINPEIIEQHGETELEEGCLSFPGVYLKIKRAAFVTIRALNEKGEVFTQSAEGYSARCFLHEIDHLNGITFFDHLSALKRQMAEKKLQKVRRVAM